MQVGTSAGSRALGEDLEVPIHMQPGAVEGPSLEGGSPPGGREGRREERDRLAGGVKELDRVGMGWFGEPEGGKA